MAGKIDTSALNKDPYSHEMAIAELFASMDKDVIFLKPSNIPGAFIPDIKMDGLEWEIKSPEGKSDRTIRRNIHKASTQSNNIIFDLSRIGIAEEKCIRDLKNAFESSNHIRNMIIVTKSKQMIVLKK
ncbi:MAG: hypothetical protein J5829_07055 [Lachnospiraceae bacterium]|nr:hypothetical protein [Lachnospiraceae bacterium]